VDNGEFIAPSIYFKTPFFTDQRFSLPEQRQNAQATSAEEHHGQPNSSEQLPSKTLQITHTLGRRSILFFLFAASSSGASNPCALP
jgi:hypothetical protein